MRKQQIRGLTVHRPWGFQIAYNDKNIENRSWDCPLPIDSFIAIHNGKKWDSDGARWLESKGYSFSGKDSAHDPAGAIIAVAVFKGNVTESKSQWYQKGSIGWQLDNIVTIPPIFCKGQQGLWHLDRDVLEQVRTSYAAKVHLYNFN
jgi:hypothetical protein